MDRLTEPDLGSLEDHSQLAIVAPSDPPYSPDTERLNPSRQLSTSSAKVTPPALKQSTPRAPFSDLTNVMDFDDDGLYGVSILLVIIAGY